MLETVMCSDELPAADRFAWWHELSAKSVMSVQMRSDYAAEFLGSLRVINLGAVHLVRMSHHPVQAVRTPRLIRRSDPETLVLMLTQRGTTAMEQYGRQAVAPAPNLLICDSSQPFRSVSNNAQSVEGTTVQIPKTLLPFPERDLARLLATRLPGHNGIGALLRSHLTTLTRHTADYTAADVSRLSALTVDLVAAMCAHHLEANAALSPETHRQVLLTRIRAFIRQHLGDPDLCADTVAAAHQISVRHLYRLFRDQDLTVAAWIRHHRLERCRRDLADPALRGRPIHAIAARWGFTSLPHFSRLFRATYGTSPADYRHHACRETWHKSSTTGQRSSTT
ncbi:AraC family transcriptional regulator [Sphaerisporangium siamense]|uniref:AraC-like DNA-binding protein n=1 Tax=Sphaerisporangium siamense TaxID=795645 RepID=A0A7W7G7P7_9ACTN|nr:helix-turn-helix domain-containing protein [Sphaerisporangium siamense]MBB4698754.1 AraC-like DNA-binding protein [Sphaerisporangium siamense]GII85185.1 AraC family transcriptional regulator [Sphaerisporangium siamense]